MRRATSGGNLSNEACCDRGAILVIRRSTIGDDLSNEPCYDKG